MIHARNCPIQPSLHEPIEITAEYRLGEEA